MGCCVAAMPPEAFLPVQHDKSVRAKKTTSFLFILHIDNFFIIPYAESSRVPNETEERKMAENMVLSFDGTKLFVNKEVDMDCRAVCVIVHGLCEHQDVTITWRKRCMKWDSAPTASTIAAMAAQRVNALITTISISFWTT